MGLYFSVLVGLLLGEMCISTHTNQIWSQKQQDYRIVIDREQCKVATKEMYADEEYSDEHSAELSDVQC